MFTVALFLIAKNWKQQIRKWFNKTIMFILWNTMQQLKRMRQVYIYTNMEKFPRYTLSEKKATYRIIHNVQSHFHKNERKSLWTCVCKNAFWKDQKLDQPAKQKLLLQHGREFPFFISFLVFFIYKKNVFTKKIQLCMPTKINIYIYWLCIY